jgi:hypothetical protein
MREIASDLTTLMKGVVSEVICCDKAAKTRSTVSMSVNRSKYRAKLERARKIKVFLDMPVIKNVDFKQKMSETKI